MLRADHSECKKYYGGSKRQSLDAYISVALSYLSKLLNKQCYLYLDFCQSNTCQSNNYQLSNILISLFIHYGRQYYYQYSLLNNKGIYERLSYIFKPSLSRYINSFHLVNNNISSINIDRSNINFKQNRIILLEKYNSMNFYYLKLLSPALKNKISEYYNQGGLYKHYPRHEYEKRNKLSLPVTTHTLSQIPSFPATVPTGARYDTLCQFIVDTDDYVLLPPTPPAFYNPFDISHSYILDDYFAEVNIDYSGNPPLVDYNTVVTEKEKLFPNKKYLAYERYKDTRCFFCHKLGHPIDLCDEVVDVDDILDPELHRLAVFVSTYGKRHIEQRFGDYDE
ncbi:MAG: hypothetical protein ACPGII_11000, partial [Opitutales bacterium]